LQRWLEIDRKPTLVICQKEVNRRLVESGLPENITVAHYNDIAGLDVFRDVRLLILVGRTAPGPQSAETQAAALSGEEPEIIKPEPGKKFSWYPKVQRGIRLADGTGRATDGDQHPDPMAEAIRWQTHEGELVQAMGRARAINRTADTPLDIDLLFDTCLPIVVDEVKAWAPPSLMIETAIEGVMLTSPIDRMRLWPRVWPNRKAAMGTLVSTLPGFEAWPYQLAGPKMNRRLAHFDRSLIPDPAEWLQTRLGPLAPL
jgi:putative DNA primase/helicase